MTLVGQAFAGDAEPDDRLLDDGGDPIGFWAYVSSSDFAVDAAENRQPEHLQFFLFTLATVWPVQRGSPESEPVDRIGRESDRDQRLGAHVKAAVAAAGEGGRRGTRTRSAWSRSACSSARG